MIMLCRSSINVIICLDLSKTEIDELADTTMLELKINCPDLDLDAYVESRLQELDFAMLCSDAFISLQGQVRTEESKFIFF